jgi:uncharacterized protein (DUF2384 family)
MKPKTEILKAYKMTPQQYGSMAMTYGMLSPEMKTKFKRVTNDLIVSAIDMTEEEARHISSMEMDAKTMGDKKFLTPKAKKRLMEIL